MEGEELENDGVAVVPHTVLFEQLLSLGQECKGLFVVLIVDCVDCILIQFTQQQGKVLYPPCSALIPDFSLNIWMSSLSAIDSSFSRLSDGSAPPMGFIAAVLGSIRLLLAFFPSLSGGYGLAPLYTQLRCPLVFASFVISYYFKFRGL